MAKKQSPRKPVTKMIDDFYAGMRGGNKLVEIPRDGEGMVDIWEVPVQVYEKAVRVGLSSLIATRQPRPSKRHPFLMRYLQTRVRKNSRLTAAVVLNELKGHDEDTPLALRGGEIWCEGETIRVSSAKHGGDETFTFKKIREYFRACKNPPSRTK